MSELILEGQNLVKDYPLKKEVFWEKPKTLRALGGVSLKLAQGQTVGIVGESGSGKSTLGEILGDLQRPSKGTVLYQGQNLRTMKQAEYRRFRRNVQFIFQNPTESMNPYFTIEKILMEPMKRLDDDFSPAQAQQKIQTILPQVGLEPDCLSRRPAELSGGQCQRIAIARALLLNPQVIVCDECVSALDVSIQAQILNLLKSLQRRYGTSYLFISHDMSVVHYMSDTIFVLVKGQVIEQGVGAELMHHPKQAYTSSLISSALFAEDALCAVQ